MGRGLDKFLSMMRLNDDDYNEFDDYDDEFEEFDEYEEEPEVVVKKKSFKKKEKPIMRDEEEKPIRREREQSGGSSSVSAAKASKNSNISRKNDKIVPIKSSGRGMEVCVLRPVTFNESSEICDVLLSGRAVVINLEGIDVELAQRIIDFISGSCYAMNGNIKQISSYIIIITPESIDISGDLQDIVPSGAAIPSFNLD